MKTEMMGEVSIKWQNVASLATDQPVTVTGADGQAAKGKLSVAGPDLQVAADGGISEIRG